MCYRLWWIKMNIIARIRRLGDENVKFRKSNIADGRHFENYYISISQPQIVRISRNLVRRHKFYPRRQKRDKKSEILKFKMADGRHIDNHFFGYNSAPYGPIETKFGMRRHNRTRTTVRWWKYQISKIQHGGRPPFWKSLSQPQIIRISRNLVHRHETWQKIRNSQIQDGGRTPSWKSFFAYNSAPSCPINTKFAVRRHNRTHTKVRWW